MRWGPTLSIPRAPGWGGGISWGRAGFGHAHGPHRGRTEPDPVPCMGGSDAWDAVRILSECFGSQPAAGSSDRRASPGWPWAQCAWPGRWLRSLSAWSFPFLSPGEMRSDPSLSCDGTQRTYTRPRPSAESAILYLTHRSACLEVWLTLPPALTRSASSTIPLHFETISFPPRTFLGPPVWRKARR